MAAPPGRRAAGLKSSVFSGLRVISPPPRGVVTVKTLISLAASCVFGVKNTSASANVPARRAKEVSALKHVHRHQRGPRKSSSRQDGREPASTAERGLRASCGSSYSLFKERAGEGADRGTLTGGQNICQGRIINFRMTRRALSWRSLLADAGLRRGVALGKNW